ADRVKDRDADEGENQVLKHDRYDARIGDNMREFCGLLAKEVRALLEKKKKNLSLYKTMGLVTPRFCSCSL
ncbi:hypothetical protein KC963_03485, partial [Candidatus Saccharibacteria bacterium]|nr:hypothetical protein [Candidatus Saccharibacteria bacterium]